MIEFLITQLFPTNTFLKTEFSTVPLMIHPLEIRLFFTCAPGLYLAGGTSAILELIVRILIEEVVPDFRFQEIHICLIIRLYRCDIAPVVIDLISVDALQVFVTDQNILYEIITVFFLGTRSISSIS